MIYFNPHSISMLKDNLIVKRLPIPETTKGGIILPLKAIELPQLGHVVAIGDNHEDVLVGDLVLVKKFEGMLLEIDFEDYYIFKFYDILAVIKD